MSGAYCITSSSYRAAFLGGISYGPFFWKPHNSTVMRSWSRTQLGYHLEYPEPSSAVFAERLQYVLLLLLSFVLALPFSLSLFCPFPFALEGARIISSFAGLCHGADCHALHHPSLLCHVTSFAFHLTDGD